jgi:hypothetical protein
MAKSSRVASGKGGLWGTKTRASLGSLRPIAATSVRTTGLTGITDAQRAALLTLCAIDRSLQSPT